MSIKRETIFSQCRKYRFTLWREFPDLPLSLDPTPPAARTNNFIQFIGLNPSLANESKDDPTIRRCIGFAKTWGFGAYCMTNLFPYITPYPEKLVECSREDDIRNRRMIYDIAGESGMTVCAWGKFDFAKLQSKIILDELKRQGRKVYHLGLNNDGSPKHPLYLRADTQPILWT